MIYKADDKRYEKIAYNKAGQSGLYIPAMSLGLWHNFGENKDLGSMREMLRTAFDNGITHFDLANNYGPPVGAAEYNLGYLVKEDFSKYRDELIISSKAGYYGWDGPYGDGGSRKFMIASCDQSLKRTGLEYFDIFYHHRMTPDTPLEETMRALSDIVKQGKALYPAISNYDKKTALKAMEIMEDLGTPLILNQNRYNLLNRSVEEDGLTQLNQEGKIGLITFSPLAQGLLTDRYINGIPEDSRVQTDGRFLKENQVKEVKETTDKLREIAQNRGQTLAQMALSWILHDNKASSVLIGASSSTQILENLEALKSTEFSDEEISLIEDALK